MNTKVVSWTGATTRLSPGAGYLANLNRTTAFQNYNVSSPAVTVQTGKVYNLTIDAGTGVRLENINN
ncbi:MAG: hypothetical protein EBR30_13435 [Cytophagia bacterium]|nr:hypothetical protein [Cytophagia bacterium]